MLLRVVNLLMEPFIHRLPSPAHLVPIQQSNAIITLKDILNGFMLATPKHRTPIRRKLASRYGVDNWRFGQTLFKPKRNIVSCMECGDFHEIHTICRTCYKKVEIESKKIIEQIRTAWGACLIDKEVEILYRGETSTASNQKRIVELERPRPMWFVSNLSQKTANPSKTIDGSPAEADNFTVKVKEDSNS